MRSHVVQSSFLTGVIDPRASARTETEAYNNGLLVGENIRLHHLGGATRRPGMVYVDTLPNKLQLVSGSATVTAPNGGTTANAKDDSEATVFTTTTGVSTTDPYVVVHYDLGGAYSVQYADVVGIVSDLGTSTQFAIQYSTDDVTWATLGIAFPALDYQDKRTYRREGPVTARYWRVAKIGGTDMGAAVISLDGFNLWSATGDVSEVRLLPFEVSTEDRYIVALTDRTATIYKDGAFVDQTATPFPSSALDSVDASNDAENMLIVHEDYPPQFLLRESATNFQRTPIVFESIPTYDYNDTLSPTPTNDTHVITFAGAWKQGDTFQIEMQGARSGVVVFAGDATADERTSTSENIARAVQKLYIVRGTTGVACVRTGTGEHTVVLGGDSADNYEVMSLTVVDSSGTVTVAKSSNGSSRREAAWSATRGYPRSVTFFEGRAYFGGTKSLQQSIFGSIVGAPLAFEVGEGLDDEAIFTTLRGQNLNAVNGLFAGRSLQLFTSGGEFRYAKQQGTPVTPADAPVNQTQYGAAKVRPVSIDGATLYVQRNRKSIRDFKYNYEEDAFDSLGVSSIAPHLVNDIKQLFVWNGSREDEISLVFAVNGDGTLAVLNSRREANVQAWVRWTTQGLVKSGAAVLEDVLFAVRRTFNGVDRLFLEQMSAEAYTDCAVISTGALRTAITGLSHLNGVSSRVRADGFVLNNVTPASGAATIERESATVEVGLNYNPTLTPMPLNTINPAGAGTPNLIRKKRVVKVRVKVQDTLGLLVNGRVVEDRKFDIGSFDAAQATPFSGSFELEETTNYDQAEDKLVTFSQVDPLPMSILGIDIQMESSQ